MFGKRKTSKFKSHIEAVVRISVDHDTEMTEEQILDEFDQNVSEDFASVMSSESRILQPTSVTVMKEKVVNKIENKISMKLKSILENFFTCFIAILNRPF